MRSKIILSMIVFIISLGMLLIACSSKTNQTATQLAVPVQQPADQPTIAPDTRSEEEALLTDRCTKCHTIEKVTSAKKSASEWENTVTRMVGKGAKLTSDEKQTLVAYLAKTYVP